MSPSYDQCSLFLYPEQPDLTIKDIPPLVSVLQEIGFVSQKTNTQNNENNIFFAGDRFLDYIAYMGCSPAIKFEASENSTDFCHIKIHYYDSAKLIHSQLQSKAPQCPKCHKPVKNWHSNKIQSKILCDQCNTTSNIEEFNWRKMAGYSRLFIEITDIFPKEAIPQQILLDKLAIIFGCSCSYFYSCK